MIHRALVKKPPFLREGLHSPEALDVECIKLRVGAEQGHLLDRGLGREDAIERILVSLSKGACRAGVEAGDGEKFEAGSLYLFFEMFKQYFRSGELADPMPGRYLEA
jgi:hypothetical protein